MQCFANNKDAYKQWVPEFPKTKCHGFECTGNEQLTEAMNLPECNILPLHKVVNPLHVPFAWHVRIDEPLRINPGSHWNCMLLGNTVEVPDKEPFLGMTNGPQLTAAKEKVNIVR